MWSMWRFIRKRDIHKEIREIAETYDAVAEGYRFWRGRPWKISRIAKGRIVLDLGSGPCVNGLYVAEINNAYVICLDLSKSMAEISRENISTRRVFGDSLVADILHIPLRSSSIDTIITIASLHHIPPEELENALREISRVIRGGGFLVATIWSWRQRRFLLKILWSMIKSLFGLIDYPRRLYVSWRSRRGVYKRLYYLYDISEIRKTLLRVRELRIISLGYTSGYRESESSNIYFVAIKLK